jgi:hypothetical protein
MARLLPVLLGGSLALASAGCKHDPPSAPHPSPTPQTALKPAPPTPIQEKREEIGGKTWDPQWDALIEKDLPPDLLSARAAHAVRIYCPRFAQETEPDKRAFWAYLFQALAGAEAGLNPTSDVHHTQAAVNRIDPVTHARSRQEGLLQLKYEDAQRYGCPFDFQHDRAFAAKSPDRTILQPENNLACGIRIMQDQIITQGKPLISRKSYWATLQPGTPGYRVFRKQMDNVPAACGLHTRTRSSSRAR